MSTELTTPATPPAWVNPASADTERFGVALLAALGVAIAGIVAWVILAETMQVRTAIVAFAVAIGTTAAFRRFAPRYPTAPVVVVGLTVASAVLGLLASQYALLAQAVHVSFFTAVGEVPLSKIPRLITIGTDPLTWIIVALSGYSGYRAAQRLRLHQEQMMRVGYSQQPASGTTPQQAAHAEYLAGKQAADR
jgi:hypothetical protein